MKNEDISPALKALNELAEEAHGNGNSWVDVIEPRVELIKPYITAPCSPAHARKRRNRNTVPVMPDQIHQMAFEEGQPAENGDGYLFTAEEFDLFVDRLLTAAAPVPPAGGDVEVLAHVQGDHTLQWLSDSWRSIPKGTELVDRAHVTWLQANCEALAIMHRQAQVKWCTERDALKAEVERKTHVYQVERAKLTEKRAKNDALQSQLTEARELLAELTYRAADVVECVHGIELPGAGVMRVRKLRAVLEDHQSAPAAKGGEQ